MKILIFAWRDNHHPDRGGSEEYLYQITRRLVEQGHQVTIFASGHPGGSLPEETINGVEIIRRGNKFTVYLWAVWLWWQKFCHQNFDIVIDQHNGISFFTPLYVNIPQVSLVYHLAFEQWFEEEKGPVARLGYMIEKYLYPVVYRSADIITISDFTRQSLMENFKFSSSQINVIRPGISRCQKTKAKSPHPTIVYLGRLKKYKRIDLLIRSLLRLRYFYPQIYLHIAGTGNYKENLVGLVKKLGLDDAVTFHGFVSEELKQELLSAAWVVANPSDHEGWGISVIEANACGTVCVGSRISGLSESIKNNQTGLLFQSGSVYDLARVLKSVLGNSAQRCVLEKEAYNHAGRFSWSKAANLFQRILKNKSCYKKENIIFRPLKSKVLKRRNLPEVAIIVPSANQIKQLSASLEGWRRQTYPNRKIIALDDYSTDGSYQYLKKAADKVYVGRAEPAKIKQILSRLNAKYVFFAESGFQYDEELLADCVYRLERYPKKEAVEISHINIGRNLLGQLARIDQKFFGQNMQVKFFRRHIWLKNPCPTKISRSRFSFYPRFDATLWQHFTQYTRLPASQCLSLKIPPIRQLISFIARHPWSGLNYLGYKLVLNIYYRWFLFRSNKSVVLSAQYE